MAAFERDIVVRFGDSDPAGIVFYPRYFEMINRLIEDWFAEALDYPFRRMHLEEHRGVPTLTVDASFTGVSRIGDVLRFALSVARLGNASFTLNIRATCDGEERLTARQVCVFTTTGADIAAEPLPDALRAKMLSFLEPEGETPQAEEP